MVASSFLIDTHALGSVQRMKGYVVDKGDVRMLGGIEMINNDGRVGGQDVVSEHGEHRHFSLGQSIP